MIKNLLTALHADENILCFNEFSGDDVFNHNEMCIFNIYLNNINLDDNFDEEDPNTIILIRLLAWHSKFEKYKVNEELMLVVLHPKRWKNWLVSHL